MNNYVTGSMIQALRKQKGMTQRELAEKLHVSDKAVSKWETGKGFPDISLLEPLAAALSVSTAELLSGAQIINQNRSSNLLRSLFYVCPICGNILHSIGESVVSCCGIPLPALEAEQPDEEHAIQIEAVEDEYFISVRHPMTKQHYLSFLAFVGSDRYEWHKLYPEGNAETRMHLRGRGYLFLYCNRHGLMKMRL